MMEWKQLVPLLSGSSVFHHHQQGSGSKSLWQKIKQVTHQITEELTSPPTTGAVRLNSIVCIYILVIYRDSPRPKKND
jgi:hypothetical protein